MLTLRPNEQTHTLLELLANVCEFPHASLSLLGHERCLRRLVSRLSEPVSCRTPDGQSQVQGRLLQVSGQKETKTIRLHKGALPILNHIHPGALESYLRKSHGHSFSGQRSHIERNHRVAEVMAMFMRAGMEYRSYALPALSMEPELSTELTLPCVYASRDIKQMTAFREEMSKTAYTRIAGALFTPGARALYHKSLLNHR